MTCPKCYADFETGAHACPECGVRLLRNISGVMKTSSVMIASGDEQTFYRSVQDVPEPLRSRLIESTHSENSGTIVIADRAGKDQITQVIARRESAKERKAAEATPAANEAAGKYWYSAILNFTFPRFGMTVWVGILLFLLAVALIVAVFTGH